MGMTKNTTRRTAASRPRKGTATPRSTEGAEGPETGSQPPSAASSSPAPMDAEAPEQTGPPLSRNTPRKVYAMRRLIEEVTRIAPEITYTIDGFDGTNAAHDVTFHTHENMALADVIEDVKVDSRVSTVLRDDKEGLLLVSFKQEPNLRDLRDPFAVDISWDLFVKETPDEETPDAETPDEEAEDQ